MNKVILIGNIVREPELRTTQSGIPSMTLDLAVQRRYPDKTTGQREADFIRCVLWRQSADYVAKYASKGTKLAVEGRMETRSYDAQDGSKRYVTEVQVEQCEILSQRTQADAGVPADAQTGFPQVADSEMPF